MLNLLYCYAPEDQSWAERIDTQLQELKRQHQIISRFDGELVPNSDQKARLLAPFDDMDVILLLVSPHFQAVEAFWQELSQESWKVRWLGGCRVVALVLESVSLNRVPAESREILPREGEPPRAEQERESAASLEVFPSDVKPLAAWPNQEQAFEQIARWLRVTFEKQWLARGDLLNYEGGPQKKTEALAAYEEALRLNPAMKYAWHGKANVLLRLGEHEEVLHRADRAWTRRHAGLIGLRHFEAALRASDEALQIDPAFPWAWFTKANALAGLKRYEEALQAYDEALRGLPTRAADIWYWKSKALKALGRKREARQAHKTARQLGYLF